MTTCNIQTPTKLISIITAHEKIEPGGALFIALRHGAELAKVKSLGLFCVVTSDEQALEKIKTLVIDLTDEFVEKIKVFKVRDLGKLKVARSLLAFGLGRDLRSSIRKSGSAIVHLHKIHFAQIPILRALQGYDVYHTAHDFGILCPLTAAVRVSDHQACSLAAGLHCSRFCNVNFISAAFYWYRQRMMFKYFKSLKIAVITPSEALKKYLEKSAPVKLSYYQVRNPIGQENAPLKTELIKTKLINFQSRQVFVTYAGSLTNNKGAYLLPEIFATINKIFEEIGFEAKFSIFGSGPLLSEIQIKIAEYDLKFKCAVNSFVPQSQLLKEYQKSSIVVVPSMGQENQSGALMEAAASGCLVVTTPLGGNCENFHEAFGCLWSQESVAKFLRTAFQSEKHYEKAISQAFEFTSKQLSWRNYLDQIKKIYSDF